MQTRYRKGHIPPPGRRGVPEDKKHLQDQAGVPTVERSDQVSCMIWILVEAEFGPFEPKF